MKHKKELVLEHRVFIRVTEDAHFQLEAVKEELLSATSPFRDASVRELPALMIPLEEEECVTKEIKGLLISRETVTGKPSIHARVYEYRILMAAEFTGESWIDMIIDKCGNVFASIQVIDTYFTNVGIQ